MTSRRSGETEPLVGPRRRDADQPIGRDRVSGETTKRAERRRVRPGDPRRARDQREGSRPPKPKPTAPDWGAYLGTGAPPAGLACLGALLYGAVYQANAWSARAFALLFYGALVATVLAQAARFERWRRDLPPPKWWVLAMRGGLTFCMALLGVWAFLPFVARPLLGFAIRMVSVLRFY